jgi:diguanylate cyclase (GGDEF)-like protein/PAS domain S-box-containing protein
VQGRGAVGAVVVAFVTLALAAPELRPLLHGTAALLAALAVMVGVRRHEPPRASAWATIAIGWGLLGGGAFIAHLAAPGPEVDAHLTLLGAPYLLGMAALVVGVFRLVTQEGRQGLRESLLDAGVVTLSATLALWLLVMVDIVHDPLLSGRNLLVALAYPLLNLAMLGTVVCLALAPRRRGPALWLLVAGLIAMLIGEVVATAATTGGTSLDADTVAFGRLLSPLLVAAAALAPDMGAIGRPTTETLTGLNQGRIAALWLAVLSSPAAFLALATSGTSGLPDHLATDLILAAAVTAVMLSLVLWRLAGAVGDLGGTLAEREASNQRELTVADVAARLARADDVGEVRAALQAAAPIVGPPEHTDVLLWLPGDDPDGLLPTGGPAASSEADGTAEQDLPDPTGAHTGGPAADAAADGEDADLDVMHIPLTTDLEQGMLVVRSATPVSAASRSILGLVAGDVMLALERCRLALELRRNEKRFRSLVQHAPDAITVHDEEGVITYASPAMGRILGVHEDSLLDKPLQHLVHPDDMVEVANALQRLAAEPHGTMLLERRLRRPDGGWRWIESRLTNLLQDRNVAGVVANHRDVTDRKRLERQLEHQATHDALTGLPNRRRLAQELDDCGVESNDAMVFIDLDRFKDINDQLGHSVGDGLLTTVAARIGATVRPGDLAARLGGDEFAVLLRGASEEQASHVAQRLLETIRQPMVVQGHELEIDASVGVAVADRNTRDLLHDADVAMYVAKREGRGRVTAFSPSMAEETLSRIQLEADLRRALEREELRVVYQPVVRLQDGMTVGVEALLRWEHAVHGTISPADFIPVAEQTGAIVPIGAWVLREACWQARALSRPGLQLSLHVNVSSVQLRDERFAGDVEAVLAATGFAPEMLTLEITESVLVDEHTTARVTIDRLRLLGVRMAIDDFGTGWSSLRYLRDVPVDVLKIDRSFVAGICEGPEDAALARAILQMARTFQLEAVAEGIEREDQREALLLRGATYGQGFLFDRPLPVNELAQRLHGEFGPIPETHRTPPPVPPAWDGDTRSDRSAPPSRGDRANGNGHGNGHAHGNGNGKHAQTRELAESRPPSTN